MFRVSKCFGFREIMEGWWFIYPECLSFRILWIFVEWWLHPLIWDRENPTNIHDSEQDLKASHCRNWNVGTCLTAYRNFMCRRVCFADEISVARWGGRVSEPTIGCCFYITLTYFQYRFSLPRDQFLSVRRNTEIKPWRALNSLIIFNINNGWIKSFVL